MKSFKIEHGHILVGARSHVSLTREYMAPFHNKNSVFYSRHPGDSSMLTTETGERLDFSVRARVSRHDIWPRGL